MKSIILAIGLVISLIAQFFLLQPWQSEVIAGNFVLAFLVVASLYAKSEQELWLCLIAGFFSDLYSSVDFGFYLGLYLLVGILTKYILKFGEVEQSSWRPMLFIAVIAFVQSMVLSIPVFRSLPLLVVTQRILTYVVLSVIIGVVWYLLLAQISEFVKRSSLTKFMR